MDKVVLLNFKEGLTVDQYIQLSRFVGEVDVVEVVTPIENGDDLINQVETVIGAARMFFGGSETIIVLPPPDPAAAIAVVGMLYGIKGYFPPTILLSEGSIVQVVAMERAHLVGQKL